MFAIILAIIIIGVILWLVPMDDRIKKIVIAIIIIAVLVWLFGFFFDTHNLFNNKL